ncbi:MAG: DUF1287 domain-containing protein [Pyrinomonadaceae bacterium]
MKPLFLLSLGLFLLLPLTLMHAGCSSRFDASQRVPATPSAVATQRSVVVPTPRPNTPLNNVIASAFEQTEYTVIYDPAYAKLEYPNGDVPRERGICADVIVRSFRAAGIDLQQQVYEDMHANFAAYPKRWGNRSTDRNIDHRRVANLMTFFERRGKALPISTEAKDYRPGDVVAWDLGSGLLHMGLVSDKASDAEPARFQIIHNINSGARLEDVLLGWKIIGRYRYFTE